MDHYQNKKRIGREHVIRKSRCYPKLEERRKCTVPRNRQDDHAHRNVGQVARQGDRRQPVASLRDATLSRTADKVVSEPDPPHANHDTVQRYHPNKHQSPAERQLFPNERQFPFSQWSDKDLLHLRVKRSYREDRDCYGDPEVPDDDMEAGLQGKEPFSTRSRIAMVIRSKGQPDGQGKRNNQAQREGP